MPVLNSELLIDILVANLRGAHQNAGTQIAEVDLSGGIDSAVMLGLAVLAVGPRNVTAVHSNINSNPEQTARAQNIADAFGVPMSNLDLRNLNGVDVYGALVEGMISALVACGKDTRENIEARIAKDPTILGSIRSTIRAPIGRGMNRLTGGGLRYGTGNEDEDRFLRFFQKGGDGEVDNNSIAILSKGETYQLALALGRRLNAERAYLPIIEATPSPDLWGVGDAHSDESELAKWLGVPFTYSRIDPETGGYKYVGTIERMNRTLDTLLPYHPAPGGSVGLAVAVKFESVLFDDSINITPTVLDRLVDAARAYFPHDQYTYQEVSAFLLAARTAERKTRHKMNPNCPTYGSRNELLELGIITNALPEI